MNLNQAIATFRDLTYKNPTNNTWEYICHLLDQCDPEAEVLAADYIKENTDHWRLPPNPFDTQYYWSTDETQPHQYCLDAMVPGSAPPKWRDQLIQGEDHPKFRTVRVLYLQEKRLGLNGKKAINALSGQNIKNLRSLHLADCPKLTGAFFKKLLGSNLPHLTCLDLSHALFKKTHLKAFETADVTLTSPTHLKLDFARFTHPGIFKSFIQNRAFHNLKHIEMKGATTDEKRFGKTKLSPEDLQAFAEALSNMKSLEYLHLGCSFSDNAQWHPLLAHPNLSKLRALDINMNTVEARAIQAMIANPALHNLDLLCLSTCDLQDDAFISLTQSSSFGLLTNLNATRNEITGESIQALLNSPWLPRLTQLDLDYNQHLTEDDFCALYSSPKTSNLTSIAVNTPEHSQEKLLHTLSNTEHLQNLTHLEFNTNMISNESLIQFAQKCPFPKLRRLELKRYSSHPPEIQEAFQNSNAFPPNCSIWST